VLSTLHTNSAAGTLPRLLDMGAEPFLVASTVNVIVAQRLVRKLCLDCRKEYQMTEKEIKNFSESYDMQRVFEFLKKNPLTEEKMKDKKSWSEVKIFTAGGCEQCHEGYHGRSGIFEVLEATDSVKKMISQKSSAEEINEKAKEEGMSSMIEDGFLKVVQGITSLEEILRVTKE
jgi:type IV pilus assembly protein PilB